MHINIHYTPSTTDPTAFHNPHIFSPPQLPQTYFPPWLLYHTAYLFCLFSECIQNFIQVKSGGKWVILWMAARCSCWARDQTLSTGSLDSETVSQGFFYQVSQGSWPLPCLLVSELTIVRTLQPVNASPKWKQPTVSEMEPIERQRSLIYPRLCQGEKWPSPCQPRLFYSQPRQLPCAWHPMLKPVHFPLSRLFY